MAIVKRYNLKGLATKIDDLYKDPEKATDCLNVYKDYSGRIVGKKGSNKYLSLAVDDMHYSREKNEHYAFTNVLKKSSDGITFESVSSPFVGSINQGIKSFATVNGILYFSDVELADPVMKYNGYECFQAGLPELFLSNAGADVNITTTAGGSLAGIYYVGVSMREIGVDGQQYNGPLTTFRLYLSSTYPTAIVGKSISTINSEKGLKMYDRQYFEIGGYSIASGVITPLNALPCNIIAGDYIKIVKKNSGKFLDSTYEKVESVALSGGKTIVTLVNKTINSATHFVAGDPTEKVTATRAGTVYNSYQKYVLDFFMSKDDETDFRYCGTYDYFTGNAYYSFPTSDSSLYALPSVDEYLDPTQSRVMPFKCKYLGSYADRLFCINIKDVDAGQLSSEALKYSVAFSSYGEGCSPETFDYSNTITVGTSDEGECVGIGTVGNNVAIMKDRATHIAVIGNDNEIGRIVKVSATVGCASNKSIINFDDACSWLSDKGVFALSKTSEPEELTSDIENIFTDNPYSLTFSGSRVAINRFNELLYFYCPHSSDSLLDRTLVYSYKYKEWFFFKGIDGSNGFYDTGLGLFFNSSSNMYCLLNGCLNDSVVDGASYRYSELPSAVGLSGKVYLTLIDSKFYKSNNVSWVEQSSADSKTAIEKWYKSGWENNGQPALEKKFNNVVAFSVQNPVYSYVNWKTKMFSDFDWNTSTREQCDDEKSFTADARRQFFNVDNTTCYSRRFEFYNNNLDEAFELSGYEFEVIQTQQRMRD